MWTGPRYRRSCFLQTLREGCVLGHEWSGISTVATCWCSGGFEIWGFRIFHCFVFCALRRRVRAVSSSQSQVHPPPKCRDPSSDFPWLAHPTLGTTSEPHTEPAWLEQVCHAWAVRPASLASSHALTESRASDIPRVRFMKRKQSHQAGGFCDPISPCCSPRPSCLREFWSQSWRALAPVSGSSWCGGDAAERLSCPGAAVIASLQLPPLLLAGGHMHCCSIF